MWIDRLIGIVPLGIGLTLIGCVWGTSWSELGPPLFVIRAIGSFVAMPFVLIGGVILFRKLPSPIQRLKALQDELQKAGLNQTPVVGEPPLPGKLKCPNCGSSPGQAEVSPHGDVKCDHCSRWYNVHTV